MIERLATWQVRVDITGHDWWTWSAKDEDDAINELAHLRAQLDAGATMLLTRDRTLAIRAAVIVSIAILSPKEQEEPMSQRPPLFMRLCAHLVCLIWPTPWAMRVLGRW